MPKYVRTRLALVPKPEPPCKECGGLGLFVIGSTEWDADDDAEAVTEGRRPDTHGMVTECNSCQRFKTGREAADFLRDWLDENEASDAAKFRGKKRKKA